jgi:hypothetical protein
MCPKGPEGVTYFRFSLASSGPPLLPACDAAGQIGFEKVHSQNLSADKEGIY